MPRKNDATNTNTNILAVLVERLNTFIDTSDKRHIEIKEELKDINDNTAERISSNSLKIDRLTQDKADKTDFQKLSDTIERRFDESQKQAENLLLKTAFDKYCETNDGNIKELRDYKNTVRGFIIAIGLGGPVITSIVTYFLIKHFG